MKSFGLDTKIEGLVLISPDIFSDERGYFFEVFKEKIFGELLPNVRFIQDNESFSTFGVLRGLHFQKPPYEQAKLVRVVMGKVLDVAVDLRRKSETFGKYFSCELSGENKHMLYIPKGFAHGFVTLSATAIFQYKVDNYYSSDHESGINYQDKFLNIDWGIKQEDVMVSAKDMGLKGFTPADYDW